MAHLGGANIPHLGNDARTGPCNVGEKSPARPQSARGPMGIVQLTKSHTRSRAARRRFTARVGRRWIPTHGPRRSLLPEVDEAVGVGEGNPVKQLKRSDARGRRDRLRREPPRLGECPPSAPARRPAVAQAHVRAEGWPPLAGAAGPRRLPERIVVSSARSRGRAADIADPAPRRACGHAPFEQLCCACADEIQAPFANSCAFILAKGGDRLRRAAPRASPRGVLRNACRRFPATIKPSARATACTAIPSSHLRTSVRHTNASNQDRTRRRRARAGGGSGTGTVARARARGFGCAMLTAAR